MIDDILIFIYLQRFYIKNFNQLFLSSAAEDFNGTFLLNGYKLNNRAAEVIAKARKKLVNIFWHMSFIK